MLFRRITVFSVVLFWLIVGAVSFSGIKSSEISISSAIPTVLAQEVSTQEKVSEVVIDYFYSPTCPFCAKADRFLNDLVKKYPQVKVNRHLASDPNNRKLFEELTKKTGSERHVGLVPMMFIGDQYFLGFDSPERAGKRVENQVKSLLGLSGPSNQSAESTEKISLPLIGEINLSDYSLPALAVVMGFLDGFNICSLGAIVLLLSLIIGLNSRRKILLYGGLFILVTTLTYGLLMVMWFSFFNLLGDQLRNFQLLVGLLAILGGLFFFRQFYRFRKYGVSCDVSKGKLTSKLFQGIQDTLKNPKSVLLTVGAVLTFAFLVTIIEFPCSAAVPVVFTGVLAEAEISGLGHLFYIILFLLFYMLDEIIVFLIAVFTMRLWIVSPKFVTYTTLIQGIILVLLGAYYLFGVRF